MSDQDFFFDEEDAKAEAKPAKKTPAKAGKTAPAGTGSAAKSSPAAAPANAPGFERTVSMTVTALLIAIALLVGIILGFLMGGGMSPAPVADTTQQLAPSGGAGALSPNQLNGPLPEGHPSIPATGSTPGTAGN